MLTLVYMYDSDAQTCLCEVRNHCATVTSVATWRHRALLTSEALQIGGDGIFIVTCQLKLTLLLCNGTRLSSRVLCMHSGVIHPTADNKKFIDYFSKSFQDIQDL